MFTNIPTEKAIRKIDRFLSSNHRQFPNTRIHALIRAIGLVMRNNIFKFGDTYWKQNTGTAMGTPPASNYANTYVGIQELEFLPTWREHLPLYKRFLDDMVGIWTGTNEQYKEFQNIVNDPEYGLEWEFSELSETINYMDLTVTLKNGNISTTLYEKPTNLHLYIPPHSAHPPGLLTGIVHGTVHRIKTLCSDETDQRKLLQTFFNNLRSRGYSPTQLTPIFRKALKPKIAVDRNSKKENKLFLHVRYHPDATTARNLHKAWSTCVDGPQWKKALSKIKNRKGKPIGTQRLVVAYSRNPNLGNLLSYRKLDKFGTSVSSFTD